MPAVSSHIVNTRRLLIPSNLHRDEKLRYIERFSDYNPGDLDPSFEDDYERIDANTWLVVVYGVPPGEDRAPPGHARHQVPMGLGEREMEQTARIIPPYVELMNEAAKAVPVSMAIDASRHGMARQAYDDMVRDGSFDSLDRTDMVDAFTDAIISTARESRMQAEYVPITNIKYGDLNGGTVKIEGGSPKRDKLRGVALLTAFLGLLAAPLIPYITHVRRLPP